MTLVYGCLRGHERGVGAEEFMPQDRGQAKMVDVPNVSDAVLAATS
jgi:hypothetical protein